MKRLFLSVVVLGAAIATPVVASADQTAPGTPGDKNCVGQTMAFIAQNGLKRGLGPGIGNVAAQANVSVQDVKAFAEAHCA